MVISDGSVASLGKVSRALVSVFFLLMVTLAQQSTADTLEVQVESDHDDAEEDAGGGTSLENDKIELGQMEWVGLRFTNVTIPQGATISTAHVSMRSADRNRERTHLTLTGEDTDDAASFAERDRNISRRLRTSASVTWRNAPSWSQNRWYDTPDISAIVQEIVGRSGWSSGNDLVILVRSDDLDGKRLTWAHDQAGPQAPRLNVEWSEGGSTDHFEFADTGNGTYVNALDSASISPMLSQDWVDIEVRAVDAAGHIDESWEGRVQIDGVIGSSSRRTYLYLREDDNRRWTRSSLTVPVESGVGQFQALMISGGSGAIPSVHFRATESTRRDPLSGISPTLQWKIADFGLYFIGTSTSAIDRLDEFSPKVNRWWAWDRGLTRAEYHWSRRPQSGDILANAPFRLPPVRVDFGAEPPVTFSEGAEFRIVNSAGNSVILRGNIQPEGTWRHWKSSYYQYSYLITGAENLSWVRGYPQTLPGRAIDGRTTGTTGRLQLYLFKRTWGGRTWWQCFGYLYTRLVDSPPVVSESTLLILREGATIPTVGQVVETDQVIPTQIADQAFGATVVAVDENSRRTSSQDRFEFTWSTGENWVLPTSPPNPVEPSFERRSFSLEDGVARVRGISMADVGRIRLSVNDANETVSHSEPFTVRPNRFQIDADCSTAEGPRSGGTVTAGDLFTLRIWAATAQNRICENYHAAVVEAARNASATPSPLSINASLNLPADGRVGVLRDERGETLTAIDRRLFDESGVAAYQRLSHSEVGIIDIAVTDPDFLGETITGTANNLGRFIPDHFAISLTATPAVIGGATDFTYGGQPFSVATTIAARNAIGSTGDLTQNYEGDFAHLSAGDLDWTALIDGTSNPGVGTLTIDLGTPAFSDGVWSNTVDAAYAWASPQIPETIFARLVATDSDSVTGTGNSAPEQWRSGRLRILDNWGPADGDLALQAEIEYLDADLDWVLNTDDSTTTLSDDVLSTAVVSGSGSAAIANTSASFTHGLLLEDPLAPAPFVLSATGVGDVLEMTVDLATGSSLNFLTSIPGHCIFRRHVADGSTTTAARMGRRILSVEDQ